MNLNTVILGGSLTSDPAAAGKAGSVATFTLSFDGPFASDRGGGGSRRDFIPVVAFGTSAADLPGASQEGLKDRGGRPAARGSLGLAGFRSPFAHHHCRRPDSLHLRPAKGASGPSPARPYGAGLLLRHPPVLAAPGDSWLSLTQEPEPPPPANLLGGARSGPSSPHP